MLPPEHAPSWQDMFQTEREAHDRLTIQHEVSQAECQFWKRQAKTFGASLDQKINALKAIVDNEHDLSPAAVTKSERIATEALSLILRSSG